MLQERSPRFAAALLLSCLGTLLSPGVVAQEGDPGPPPTAVTSDTPDTPAASPASDPILEIDSLSEEERLDQYFAVWLKEVELLMSRQEREFFARLETPYQRQAFIDRFWRARDPFPKTARNELRERWQRRLHEARARFGSLSDNRARIYMVHGPPEGGFEVVCTKTFKPVEVWYYSRSDEVDFSFALVFFRARGRGDAQLWTPDTIGINSTLDQAQRCINGEQLTQVISQLRQAGSNYYLALQRVIAKPKPRSSEWLQTFLSLSTEVPEGVETFDAKVDIAFPGRYQSRTVIQGRLEVPVADLVVGDFAGYRSYEFALTGEVVSGNNLFENFRYKFGVPADTFTADTLPLAFQRFLRPGDYTLILRLKDLNGDRFFRYKTELSVPRMEAVFAAPTPTDPENSRLFAEATAAIQSGETSIKLIPPAMELLTGFVRFDTLAVGDEIQRVQFFLDDQRLLTKNRPPYNVEIDLGPFPRLQELRVEALDAGGEVVAEDVFLVNSGGNRFAVQLKEPRRGQRYDRSLLARAEVEVPESRSLERVEFYLDETLVATLFQEPFVQPIQLPSAGQVSYVRAVAYLPDGNSTEDLVFINAPKYLEEVDVQFVELYTSVLDRAGRPVQNLTRDDFEVFEDGERQRVRRFERVENLPIHVGVLLDNSGSMRDALNHARGAALTFFQQAITPRDRAAIITFNRVPNLSVKLTNDLRLLGGGLAGLTAEGETALYDSLMFGLYYFTGIKGQRALLVLSDGRDEASRFSFDETLEYARRAGVTVYTIGLASGAGLDRVNLQKLADETGGRSFFIRDISKLTEIYTLIQQDLRSQYLLAYQSSNTSKSTDFRTIELKLSEGSYIPRTISGYYP